MAKEKNAYNSALINLCKESKDKLGLIAGKLSSEQATAIRFLLWKKADQDDPKDMLELFSSMAFGNDSQMRQFIAKEVFGIEGKVSKADKASDLLASLGIDAE